MNPLGRLAVGQIFLNINHYFFAIDGKNYLGVFEKSEALEFQGVSGDAIDHIASDVFCLVFLTVVYKHRIGHFNLLWCFLIHKNNISSLNIVQALIADLR